MSTQLLAPPSPRRGTIHHRRSVAKMTPGQLKRLRGAFRGAMELGDQRGYWYFAGWHGVPFEWCEHNSPIFLPWHRAYLHYLELALQERVRGVSLPWWDWTATDSLPDAYVEEIVEGEENPLAGRKIRVYGSSETRDAQPRQPGAAAQTVPPRVPDLPYRSQWDWAMEATAFGEFQRRIEAIHGWVHVWVGGIMREISWAAYDPIFFAHHVMVDRAWRIWQHRNPGALPAQDLLDEPLSPNGMTVRQTLSVKRLGYEYAGTASHVRGTIPAGGGG